LYKTIGMEKRIKVKKEAHKLEITIKAFYDASKQKMLFAWIILFSLCGISIITQFFQDYDANYKIIFGVYLAFWLFFEFKVIYAYRWRRFGEEKISIENNQIILSKTIGKRGVTQQFNWEEIKKIDLLKNDRTSFLKSMNSSYWNINKFHLALYLEKSIVPFAIDINNKEASTILNELRKMKK
jgi:hypothetical protein